MSVYKPKGSPYYHFDFQFRGRRFHGSTGCKDRRQADAVERTEREKAKAVTPCNTHLPRTYGEAAVRFWNEVAQHNATASDTRRYLVWLGEAIGEDTLLSDIDSNLVSKLVARRRGERRWCRTDLGTVAPATVNRSVTETLQRVFTRARLQWGMRFDREPEWRKLMLPEAQEHVRELREDEADAITLATRPDYAPFMAFARATGLRLRECLLKWSEVDWGARKISKKGKGGFTVTTPITSEIEAILAPLVGNHPTHVFTYIATRTRADRVRGRHYPLTYNGVKTLWRRLRESAGVEGFRFP